MNTKENLFEAVAPYDASSINEINENGQSLNFTLDGYSFIGWAFRQNSSDQALLVKIFEQLISLGADINYSGEQVIPLLHLVVDDLATVKTEDRLDTGFLEFLLARGANPNLENDRGEVLIDRVRHAIVMELLLRHGARAKEKNDYSRLFLRYGNRRCYDLIEQTGVELSFDTEDIHTAIGADNLPALKTLIGLGVDVETPSSENSMPIETAIACGAKTCLNHLISEGITSTSMIENGASLLHYASVSDIQNQDIYSILATQANTIDTRDPDGRTPLHYAAISQSNASIEILLKLGADPNIKDADGATALHNFVALPLAESDLTTLDCFIDSGSDVNGIDNYGENLLFRALTCETDRSEDESLLSTRELLEYLVAKGCNPGIRDDDGHDLLEYYQTSEEVVHNRDSDTVGYLEKIVNPNS